MSDSATPVTAAAVDEADEYMEIGATGLRRSGGHISEEFLVELQGPRAAQIYQEMSSNDPIVGGMLFAIDMLIRQVDWKAESADTTPAAAADADFLDSNLHDMEQPFTATISEIMSMMVYGFSPHEIVYKKRSGPNPPGATPDPDDPSAPTVARSAYNDGQVGWRKLPIRGQDTITDWIFNDRTGDLIALEQQPPPTWTPRTIPAVKFGLFRTSLHKDNPEGRSVLRNAYRPWYFKKTIEEIEAIGIERELAGLPVARIPARFFAATATAAEKSALDGWRRTVRDLRRDAIEGIVMPNEFDANGKNLYDLELLSTGGSRQIDTNDVIRRKNQEIATTVLADFILLGHEKVGSFALADSKTDVFSVAITGWLDMIADVFNRDLIPRLFALNGRPVDVLPQLTHGDIETPNLAELGAYMKALADVGMPLFPNELLQAKLLEVADLPLPLEGFVDEPTPDDE